MAQLLFLVFLLLTPSLATTGLRMELRRMHAACNTTEFMRGVVRRDMQRAAQLGYQPSAPSINITTPLEFDDSMYEFVIEMAIGTPPLTYQAIIDTGSDLIWTQCAPCDQCFNKTAPLYSPSSSSSYTVPPCNSSTSMCLRLPQYGEPCQCPTCPCRYNFTYGVGWTAGVQSTETFTFGSASAGNQVVLPGLMFGCSNASSDFPGSSGLVGLGRGYLSLVSQLGATKFSYCLAYNFSSPNSTSPLFIGPLANLTSSSNEGAIQSTPLLHNPNPAYSTFYYVPLVNISLGTTKISIPPGTFSLNANGTGGIFVDSGTAITYLFDGVYQSIRSEILSLVTLPVANGPSSVLDLCFSLPSAGSSPPSMPNMTFHFEGADMVLPPENYMTNQFEGLWCLVMSSTSNLVPTTSIFGNYQQQNMHFLFDLDKEMLSFVPVQCSSL